MRGGGRTRGGRGRAQPVASPPPAPAALYPAPLLVEGKMSEAARILSVRIYAEPQFRKQNEGWQLRYFKLVEQAGHYLHGALGIDLEIVQMKDWPGEASFASLDGALLALEAIDRAEDVDLVIGLVASNQVAVTSFHQMGTARILGRYMVLRGLDESEEMQAMSRAVGKAAGEDRDRVFEARLRHKQVSMLLHELGHLLGGLHVSDPESLMFAEYNDRMRGYGDANEKLMDLVVAARDPKKKTPDTEKQLLEAVAAHLKGSEYAGWGGYDRERMIAILLGDEKTRAKATDRDLSRDEEAARGGGEDKDTPRVGPKTENEKLKDASDLAHAGNFESAWIILKPISESHLNDAELQAFACQLGAIQEPKEEASLDRCRHALSISNKEIAPALYTAYLLTQKNESKEALATMREAEKRLAAQKDPKTDLWPFLAELYQSVNAITFAEEAAEKSADKERTKNVRAWAEQARRIFGLARDKATELGVPPEREADYIARRMALEKLLADAKASDAEKLSTELRSEFPKMPAGEDELCEWTVRRRAFPKARAICDRAIHLNPASAKPHVMLAMIAFSTGSPAAAIPHLERAIELDPDARDVWSMLHGVYRATHKADRAKDLARRYQDRFGEALR
jgi:predicted Zn-dependent protease